MPLLLLFIIVPIIEIILFIQIGDQIGLGWTILSVIATAFIGTTIVRKQGLAAWNKAQSNMQHSQLPMEEVFTGLCLLVAGALLLTPGFLTDAIGFTLLVPTFRKSLGQTLWGWIRNNGNFQMRGNFTGQSNGANQHSSPFGNRSPFTQEDIIDGDYTVVTPEDPSDKDGKKPTNQINHKPD